MADPRREVRIRTATAEDRRPVRQLIDSALLALDDPPGRIEDGEVLVAVDDADEIVGTVVVDPSADGPDGDDRTPGTATDTAHVDAIAVRRSRRARGVGTALIEAVADRHGTLTAAFDPRVRPFYESLGFEIEPTGEDRLFGRLDRD